MQMNTKTLPRLVLALFAAALLMPAALVRADEDTELAKHMEVIEKGMKSLKKSLKNSGDNAASGETVAGIKKAAAGCVELIPAMAKKVPEAKRAEFVANYKKDMGAFVAELDKLAAAVKAGKNEDALAIHKALGEMEDKGHEKYTSEE
jgi:soluble cytochrome b562